MTRSARRRFTDDFKQEAVRLTLTSGRTIKQVADDLGIGLSTLTRWRGKHIEADLLSGPHDDVEKELARLRKENNLLRQERDLLKKATAFFAGKVDEVPSHRREEGGAADRTDVYVVACQRQRLLRLAAARPQPASA